jgi:hypothetical protein
MKQYTVRYLYSELPEEDAYRIVFVPFRYYLTFKYYKQTRKDDDRFVLESLSGHNIMKLKTRSTDWLRKSTYVCDVSEGKAAEHFRTICDLDFSLEPYEVQSDLKVYLVKFHR